MGFYGIYLYIAPSLPEMSSLKKAPLLKPLQVYTADNELVAEYGGKLSVPVEYKQIPPAFIHAFLAAEDSSFFEHSGISFKGLGRAVTESVTGSDVQTGGSTITMQVAKNYYLSPERTLKRKLTEIFLARKIEQNLSKEEILTLYVNKIFLGKNAYGIAAAAKIYYNKSLDELSLAQMAMLAGCLKLHQNIIRLLTLNGHWNVATGFWAVCYSLDISASHNIRLPWLSRSTWTCLIVESVTAFPM